MIKGYYKDQYILEFEHKKSHKTFIPLINRGTWTRVYAIRSMIEKVVNNMNGKGINIINLGAGLDSLYFIMNEKFSNIKYYELDYEDICYKKVFKNKVD